MNLQRKNKLNAEFSMASLTDLIFLLLIFFMLSSTLVSPNALNLLLPKSNSRTVSKQTVSVSITKDLEYYVDKQKTPMEGVKVLLQNKLAGVPEPTVALHVEKTVPIEYVVEVMSIANEMGIKMVLATQPKE